MKRNAQYFIIAVLLLSHVPDSFCQSADPYYWRYLVSEYYQTGTPYPEHFDEFEQYWELHHAIYWSLSSVPQQQTDPGMFPENTEEISIQSGFNRAKLAWYQIDPLFYDQSVIQRPPNVTLNDLSKHYVRQILEVEVFAWRDHSGGYPEYIRVLNLAFYPSEKGQYNYDVEGVSGVSAGINEDGSLNMPETRWGGIMCKIEQTDFVEENIRFIEFWLMDPFLDGQTSGGDLYLNIGDISEDILRDNRMQFENGLPTASIPENTENTIWGQVPGTAYNYSPFSPLEGSRKYQDVGLDGLCDEDELIFFQDYLENIVQEYGMESQAYQRALEDPSSDNYHHFRGSEYDSDPLYSSILERYKKYNRLQGNSPTVEQNPEIYPTSSTITPDREDTNRDGVLDEAENYFQYKITLDPDNMQEGENFIADIRKSHIRLPNTMEGEVNWYKFKIPINEYEKMVGDIQDFRSIRFMRIFLKNFYEPVILRFASLTLVQVVENPKTFEIVLFPNPCKNTLKINFPEPIFNRFDISIANSQGMVMYEQSYFFGIYHEISIDVSKYDPGLYIFTFSTSLQKTIKKFIVYGY